MASSQVEISPSSRFGHVLRDRNHQTDSYRTRDNSSVFKDLGQTHLSSRNSSLSKTSGSSDSYLNQRMDYADLWVHNPRGPNNENNIDSSSESELNGISDHSIVNQGSNNQSIDFTDLWVHIPERNNFENDQVNNKTSGKWDRARELVISIQKKNRDVKLPKPVSNSQRKESKNDSKSSEPSLILQKSNSRSKVEYNPNGRTLEPIIFEKSPARSECSANGENFCGVSSIVSSLVQKWRGYEAGSKSLNSSNSGVCECKANSSLFFAECPSFSEASSTATPMMNANSFADWESLKTGLSGPSSSMGRDSDASDPVRVADIIKKLSSSVEEPTVVLESLPCVRTSRDQAHSPRLRGRHVFCDLLMLMERQRHRELEGLKECKVVSRFSHKRRIQAMLRLRLLRYGSELKDAQCTKYSLHKTNRKEPAIFRKRLNSGQVDPVRGFDMISPAGESMSTQFEKEKTGDASGSRKANGHQANLDSGDLSELNPSGRGDIISHNSMLVVNPSSTNSNGSENLHQDQLNLSDSNTQELSEFKVEETKMQFPQVDIPRVESINAISNAREEEDDTQNSVVSDCDWTSDVSRHPNDWEELHSDYSEIDRDWISDVSRPRSTWEYLRQTRYQEMCDPFHENHDIRRLLERKSVSSFLSSGLRERIDQIMLARTQNSIKPNVHATGGNSTQIDEEDERSKEEEKLHEEEKIRQNNEASNYAANEIMSWVRDNESSDNHSDRIESSYIEGSPLSCTYSQGTGPNHNSIGIELMYELRRNMEQLREEVADLRNSVKSCMNMQIELQNSFKKEVAPCFTQSGRKKRKDVPQTPKFNGGRCCICCDSQIDTLLYRCGHMCTCFNCAQELQWGTGKCPVCRSPILDIVQPNFLQ